MKIFTPIVASLVLACVATQGDLIAQNRRENDLRQQIRRIVREEMKRALAEIHETRDRATALKKAAASKKVQATKLRVQRGARRKQAAARADRAARVRKVAETKRAQPRKSQPRKIAARRPSPQRRSSPNDALDRAHKALQNARRALADAERALNRARRAGPRPTTARTIRRGKDGTYIVETTTGARTYRAKAKGQGQVLRVVVPKIEIPTFKVRMVAPIETRVVVPIPTVRTWVLESGKGQRRQLELVPITEVKKAKKKNKKKKSQKKKKPQARRAKKRRGRIV